jgi:hypothetical protein
MEFFVLGVAVAVLYGLLTVADSIKSVAKQMKRQNLLHEAELRSKGVEIGAAGEDSAQE